MPATSLDTIVSLCKRRGFVFPSSSVYGGLGSTWDYGPLGVELKNNVKRAWWRSVVHERDDMEGLDAAILMNRLVWKYSGHEATFSDPMTDCRACKARPRADHVFAAQKGRDPKGLPEINAAIEAKELALPEVRVEGSDPGPPLQPHVPHQRRSGGFGRRFWAWSTCGPKPRKASSSTSATYSIPCAENCRSASPRLARPSATKLRRETFTFRTREFEQMEIEYFVRPGEDEAAHEAWIAERTNWYLKLGMRKENLRVREQEKHELAHYAKRCVDLEYRFPMGWSELEGIANRTDFDLKAHSRSPENPDAVGELKYFDQEQKKHLVPYVIEPSAGADRATLAFLCDAYEDALVKEPPAEETTKLRELVESFAKSVGRREGMAADVKQRLVATAESIAAGLPGTLPQLIGLMEDSEAATIEVMKKVRGVGEKIAEEHTRTVLHLHPRLAPLTVAVFPLKRNDARLVEMARGLKRDLQRSGVRAVYDDTGAIGKLYRRQDEIGTPWCVTVDFQSLEDQTVTVRDRDSMQQERLKTAALAPTIAGRLA